MQKIIYFNDSQDRKRIHPANKFPIYNRNTKELLVEQVIKPYQAVYIESHGEDILVKDWGHTIMFLSFVE